MGKSSLLYWFPKIQDLGIPVPRTEIVEIPFKIFCDWMDSMFNEGHIDVLGSERGSAIKEAADKTGYPLFLRTDLASGKHQWKATCYVEKEEELPLHLWNVVEFNFIADIWGLPCEALVFREFIPLDSGFTAFNGLPISRERRYFVRDGIVECHHPYWIEDAIAEGYPPPNNKDWRQLLTVLNQETPDEFGILGPYAASVGKILGGYWSVDFAMSQDGIWYLLDMAVGEESWHPEHITR